MNDLLEKNRELLLKTLEQAQRRLDTLKETVKTANDGMVGSDIRMGIDDVITPLKIAFEIAEPI